MTKRIRRNVLKGLAVSLPAAWSTPVVKTIVMPAHAQTSNFANCNGVFCNLDFGGAPVCGSAAVIDGVLTMRGLADASPQTWSGNGPVSADGSFTIGITFDDAGININGATGTVAADCSTFSGTFTYNGVASQTSFTGTLTVGATSLADCNDCTTG